MIPGRELLLQFYAHQANGWKSRAWTAVALVGVGVVLGVIVSLITLEVIR